MALDLISASNDYIQIGIWSFDDKPYAESFDAGNTSGWGLNNNWRNLTSEIGKVHTGLEITGRAAVPAHLSGKAGLWLKEVGAKKHLYGLDVDGIILDENFRIGQHGGLNNTLIGVDSGYSLTTGNSNVFVGYKSGYNSTTNTNTCVGFESGKAQTTGYDNVFVGYKAGGNVDSAMFSTYVGWKAGYGANAMGNVCVGHYCGANAIGNFNTLLGVSVNGNAAFGTSNVAIGLQCGHGATGNKNVFIGNGIYEGSGGSVAGDNNVIIGYNYIHGGGSGKVCIGYESGKNDNTSNKLYIANSDTVTPLIYGEFDTNELKINGALEVTGKLTVGGLIDPTGLSFTPQVANPLGTLKGLWIDSADDTLHYFDGTVDITLEASINNHNDLSGLQGGAANSYIHAHSIGTNNISLGNEAGVNITGSGSRGVNLGVRAGYLLEAGSCYVNIGYEAGYSCVNGSNNVNIGFQAGKNSTRFRNVFIGYKAGQSNINGDDNIFIGNEAGINELGSDKLYIDSSSTSSPLIYGDFSTPLLRFHTDDIEIGANIKHIGDTNNLIAFGTDTQDYQTGGSSRLDISDAGVRLGGANSRVTTILDEDAMGTDSATALSTQQSIKAYVDTQVATKIANVVDDTTPQLGGDLDMNAKGIDFPTTANVTDCKDEDDMASDSATMLATQQSIKAFGEGLVTIVGVAGTKVADINEDNDNWHFLDLSAYVTTRCTAVVLMVVRMGGVSSFFIAPYEGTLDAPVSPWGERALFDIKDGGQRVKYRQQTANDDFDVYLLLKMDSE